MGTNNITLIVEDRGHKYDNPASLNLDPSIYQYDRRNKENISSVSVNFQIIVQNSNDTPYIKNSIPNFVATENEQFQIFITTNTFDDYIFGDIDNEINVQPTLNIYESVEIFIRKINSKCIFVTTNHNVSSNFVSNS